MPKWLNIKIILLVVVVIAMIVAGVIYYRISTIYPSTEDAYVNANSIHVSAQVGGKVQTVRVHNYQTVKKGQVLFTIDPRPYQFEVQEASANLALAKAKAASLAEQVKEAQAQVDKARATAYVTEQNNIRIKKLVKQGQMSVQMGYQTEGKYKGAKAGVSAAKEALLVAKRDLIVGEHQVQVNQAILDGDKLDLGYTKIVSPASGYIVQFNLRPGSLVTKGADLFVVVDNSTWWVDANYKETQLERMRVGQIANVKIDMYPHTTFKGKIIGISRGSGSSFSLLPAENASGNWVKVIQRYPVRILLTRSNLWKTHPLRVGASADVSVNTIK